MSRRDYAYTSGPRIGMWIGIIVGSFVGFIVLIAVFGAFYTTDERERGVYLRNGAVTGITDPGFGFKMPFIDSVVFIPISEQTSSFEEDTYSFDQQLATITLTVNWRIDPSRIMDTYVAFGNVENVELQIIRRRVPDALKPVFGRFNAQTAIQDRARLNQEISSAIIASFAGTVVVPISVQVEDIAFSTAYENSVEQRMLAEVEVTRIQQNVERERATGQITVIQAQATADSNLARATAEATARVTQATATAEATRLQASADAEAILVRGQAEAEATRLRADAVSANPNLVNLVAAERWDGALPTHMIPGGTLPFIDVTPVESVRVID